MNRRYLIIGLLCCWSCSNIEDAKPSQRATFIKFYEAPHDMYGVSAEATDDGFIILGNEKLSNGNYNSVLIRTDRNGERLGDDIILPDGYAKALKVFDNGYYVVGDSVKSNLESSEGEVADLEIYAARLFKVSLAGDVIGKIVIADRLSTSKITDIHINAITFNSNEQAIAVGTFKEPGKFEQAYVTAFDKNLLDTVWHKQYDINGRNYENSKSVHIAPSGNIIWASDLIIDNQSFAKSYLAVPYLEENSTFLNYNQFGENTDQYIVANEIQPAKFVAAGFGIIGTYASINNTQSNLFFIRTDQYGKLIEGSERYFDGAADNISVGSTESQSEDTGNALTSTKDGGFILAGSTLSTPNHGSGGKDILLVKINASNEVVWRRLIGGAGDETVNSIKETSDGNLLICGSNNLSGLSSLFLIKTNKNGELKD